jgi:hypothetical protein
VQPKRLALGLIKRRALIQCWIVQQIHATQANCASPVALIDGFQRHVNSQLSSIMPRYGPNPVNGS